MADSTTSRNKCIALNAQVKMIKRRRPNRKVTEPTVKPTKPKQIYDKCPRFFDFTGKRIYLDDLHGAEYIYRVKFRETLTLGNTSMASFNTINGLYSWGVVYGKSEHAIMKEFKRVLGNNYYELITHQVKGESTVAFTIHKIPHLKGVSYKPSFRTCDDRFYVDFDKNIITCGYGKNTAQQVKFPRRRGWLYSLDVTLVCERYPFDEVVKYTGTIYGVSTKSLIGEVNRMIAFYDDCDVDTMRVKYVLCENPQTMYRRHKVHYRSNWDFESSVVGTTDTTDTTLQMMSAKQITQFDLEKVYNKLSTQVKSTLQMADVD